MKLPFPDSRMDATRKAVLNAEAVARRRISSGELERASASTVLRIGREEALNPKSPFYGHPFSRASLYKYGGSGFHKVRHGQRTDRYLSRGDRIPRRIDVLSTDGVEKASTVRGSADASKVRRHHRAMMDYLRKGDSSRLRGLLPSERTLSDGRVLETDTAKIKERADAGELDDFAQEHGS